MVVLAPATPVTQAQKRALAAYILRKRAGYAKKDAAIKAKFKWLEELNQTDPDLEGIEISERSLEILEERRVAMGEEKHQLFEKLKNLLAQDDEDEPQPSGVANPEQPGTSYQPAYPQPAYPPYPAYPQPAYPQPPYFQPRPRFEAQPPRFEAQPPRYPIQTEPITPKKPSELSPTRSRSLLSRGESPPRLPLWEDVSPGHSPKFAPKTLTESKESRINSFTKAFSESLSKAMLSEQAIKCESPIKLPPEVKEKAPEKKEVPKFSLEGKAKPAEGKRASSVSSNESKKVSGGERLSGGISVEGKKTPAEGTRTPGGERTSSVTSETRHSVTSETKRSVTSDHSAHTPTSISPKTHSTQLVSPPYKSKSPNIKREVEKRREEREKCDQGDGEMAPVVRISKAEIHSKVMSWPTERHAARRDVTTGSKTPGPGSKTPGPGSKTPGAGSKTPGPDQKKGKKDEKDGPGSSLLEFAFQSALFGNNLFNDSQTTSPGGGKASKEPATPAPTSATASGTSDLLAALSLSYGNKKPVSSEVPPADTRKRARSPSPELVEVYQHKTKSPPPPPPPPPKPGRKVPPSSTPNSTANVPPTSPHQAPAVCYPPFRSPSHPPTSPYPFLSPTLPTSQQLTSPMHSSPVMGSPLLAGYNSPSHRSPSIAPGMLPMPSMMPPPPGMPPMPPPGLPTMPPPGCPGMLQHPGQLKSRSYNRYNYQ